MDDLKLIKKYYGENFMHLCKKLFPTILEESGTLYNIISNKFSHSKNLYNDLIEQDKIMDYKNYIYSFTKENDSIVKSEKTPFELMNDAGYNLYECKNQDEILSFKKYYKKNEELCTFKEERLKTNYVFFAVKKDVDKIKREDFKVPKRQDKYGISVISIQFTKGDNNILSIKNRYNHNVENPDATYSNNLENIIPGLTYSFNNYYKFNIDFKDSFELNGWVKANDNKFYKYNYEINNIYYCTDNIIIDSNRNVINDFKDKEKFIVIDYFILDIVHKKIYLYDERLKDSFIDSIEIKKINILKDKNKNTKTIEIIPLEGENIIIKINSKNQILGYINNNVKAVKDNFLCDNITVNEIIMNNLEQTGDYFLEKNKCLKYIEFNKLKNAGNNFISNNRIIEIAIMNNLEKAGHKFMYENRSIKMFLANNLKKVGNYFFSNASFNLISLVFNKLEVAGDGFFDKNISVKNFQAPNLRVVGNSFFRYNKNIEELILDKLEVAGDMFLYSDNMLKYFSASKLKKIGKYFLKKASYVKCNFAILNEDKIKKGDELNGKVRNH